MKKILLLFGITIILISFASALNWDNVKSYEKETETIIIKNAFGLPFIGADLAKYKLTYNTDQCLINCRAEGTATLYTDGYLFTDLNFEDSRGKTTSIKSSKISIYETTIYDINVDDYETSCELPKIVSNGTEQECSRNKIGSHQEERTSGEWVEYDNSVLPPGEYRWKIEGKKSRTERIDWIGTSFGEDFDEWAWWDTNWLRKKQIDITGGSITFTDFQQYFVVEKEPEMGEGYGDLRFINDIETTEFDYEVDWSNSSSAGVWVKISTLTNIAVNTTIFMYYDNALALSGEDSAATWPYPWLIVNHFTNITSSEGSTARENDVNFTGPHLLNTSQPFGFGIDMEPGTGWGVSNIEMGVSGISNFTAFIMMTSRNNSDGILTLMANSTAIDTGGAYTSKNSNVYQTTRPLGGAFVMDTVTFDQHWWAQTYNTSSFELYFDAQQKGSQNTTTFTMDDNTMLFGTTQVTDQLGGPLMDEFWLYNNTMSSDRINRTFETNNTNFYLFGDEEIIIDALGLGVLLNEPINNLSQVSSILNFNASLRVFDGTLANITNATAYVWNPDTTLFDTNTIFFSGELNETNVSLDITGLTPALVYSWNIEGCVADGIGNSTCAFAIFNRTFNIDVLSEVAETFSLMTLEGDTEQFQLNITTADLPVSVATLIYNNTRFAGTVVNTGGFDFTLTRSLVVPNVIALTNKTFFWEIELSGGFSANSTKNNQTVQAITLDNCESNTVKIINFTIVDEEFQTFVANTATNMSIEINISSADRSLSILTLSNNYTHINPVEFCLSINLTDQTNYLLDSTTKYQATDYATEYYNIRDFTVNNITTPETIILYDLLEADSTEFKIIFTDENFIPVENALIFIERQYISEATFKTVELPLTDSNGETVGHFVRNDVVYNIRVVKNNQVIGLFQNIRAFCDDFSIGACIIELEASSDSNFGFEYNDAIGLIFSENPVFNANTSVMSFSFSTVSGNTETVFMDVTRNDVFGNQTLCTDSLTSASGTLACVVNPDIDDTTLVTTISIEGVDSIISNTEINRTGLGSIGYLMWFIMSLLFILMVGEHKTGIFVGMLISYVGALSLGLIERTLFGVGSAGIWLIVITIMGIYKLNKERGE